MAVAIAIVMFGIFSIGHGSRLFVRTEPIKAHFQRINGLQTGAPVTLSGVRIGAVESIHFPSDPYADYVVVAMWIERSARDRVRTDSVAQIRTVGLLGDKYIELTPGSPTSPPVEPGGLLAARNPIDYESLFQRKGTDDLIANMMAIAQSVRTLLDQIEKGHGLLSALITGEHRPGQQEVTVADFHRALDSMERLSYGINQMVEKINRGQGLAGAMFSEKTNGQRILANVERAAVSLNESSRKVNALIDRFDRAQGMVPRLIQDKPYADQVLANVRQSSADLRDVLEKVNSGQGTIGLAVNDPALYNEAKVLFSPSGSVGWGVQLLNGMYSLTHPFTVGPSEASTSAQPVTATSPGGAHAPGARSAPGTAPGNDPVPAKPPTPVAPNLFVAPSP